MLMHCYFSCHKLSKIFEKIKTNFCTLTVVSKQIKQCSHTQRTTFKMKIKSITKQGHFQCIRLFIHKSIMLWLLSLLSVCLEFMSLFVLRGVYVWFAEPPGSIFSSAHRLYIWFSSWPHSPCPSAPMGLRSWTFTFLWHKYPHLCRPAGAQTHTLF